MRDATRQLERVRWIGRTLLVGQPLFQWLAAVEVALLAAALIDFALRLPGWLRLVAGVGAAVAAVAWLVTRVVRAVGVRPDLGALALRAEQLHPELTGMLASGVEFSLRPERYADTPRTAALANATVRELEGRLRQGIHLGGLLNLKPSLGRVGLMAAATLLLIGAAAASPQNATIAMHRWLSPLGSTQWPRRTSVQSLMVEQRVWPSDTSLRLRAHVEKGYRAGMRTWAVYRFVTPATPDPAWQWALMNEQAAAAAKSDPGAPGPNPKSEVSSTPGTSTPGTFERLLDLPESVRSGAASAANAGTVEFRFEAGDDASAGQSITLIDRPALRATHLTIEPPAYARGLIATQDVDLDQQSGQIATATALVGSQVRWTLDLNKPIPPAWVNSDQFMPGLQGIPGLKVQARGLEGTGDAGAPQVTLAFPLNGTVQSVVRLQDEYGLSNLADRLYRIEGTVDQPPAVSMTLPVSDETVLPGATVPLEAVAQDDVGVESLELQLQSVRHAGAATPATSPTPRPVAQTTGRAAQLKVSNRLELAAMALQPGDEVDVTAVARDVYELDGQRHDPVRSTPRRLHVIDAATLAGQIWSDLAGVREQAVRLEGDQRELYDAGAAQALPGQQEMSQRIDTQAGFVRALQDRAARNHLDDATLAQVLQRANELLQQGNSSSQGAAAKLEEARRATTQPAAPRAQARDKQVEVGSALATLVDVLDQGQGTAAAQLKIGQIISQLQALNGGVRAALPRTAGKDPSQLSRDEKREIDDIADRQKALTGAADALVASMESEGNKLSGDSDPQKRATGKELQEAAAIAKRQGLDPSMKAAADAAKGNKLSEASSAQEQSLATLQAMRGQFGSQEQQRQEELMRQLAALSDAVKKLIEQQTAQIQTLEKAADIRPLDEGQSTLRRNTLALGEQAKGARGTAMAGKHLDEAGDRQGDAITALRAAKKDPATTGEHAALTSLESALAELDKQAQQAQNDQTRQMREKLKGEYETLAKRQDTIKEKTQALTDQADLPRDQRGALIDLGREQAEVQTAAAALRSQVAKTLLFAHLHDRIDHVAGDLVERLRAARADRDIPLSQGRIAAMLRTMAAALDEAQRQEPYTAPEGEGGSGGGGGGGSQPLVPPAAELKLLRGMQEDVLDQTRDLASHQSVGPEETDRRDRAILDLSNQQRELSGLGARLIQKMQMTPHSGDNKPPGSE